MIHTLSNSALGKKWQLFWQEKKGRSEVRVTGPHVIADGTSVVAGSAQGLLGHHLSALQWEASSPAGARPLLWMWQLAAQPACKTTTGRTSSPTPSLPQWAEPQLLLHHVNELHPYVSCCLWYTTRQLSDLNIALRESPYQLSLRWNHCNTKGICDSLLKGKGEYYCWNTPNSQDLN